MGQKELVWNLEETKKELAQRITKTRQKKINVIKAARRIWSDHSTGKISNSEYQKQLNEEFKGRHPQKWVDMYDLHIEECKKVLQEYNKESKKSGSWIKILTISLIILGLIIGGLFFFVYDEDILPEFAPPTIEQYTQNINFTTNQNTIYNWQIENSGILQSLILAGSLEGQGQTKIFLVDNSGNEFLILDGINLGISLSPTDNTTESNLTNVTIPQTNVTNVTGSNATIQGKIKIPKNKTKDKNFTDPPQTNVTNVTIKFAFSQVCEETCDLSGLIPSLNQSSYDLRIEIENSTLTIDSITYDMLIPGIPENKTNITIPKEITKEEYKHKRGKKVKISGPDSAVNVPVSTDIPESWNIEDSSSIRVYWEEQDQFIDFDSFDDDGDGKIDRIDWIVPHLSNQTFNVIIITNAQHLDSNKDFVSNVYEEVKTLDNIWSETIPDGDYVRVTFEKNLTSNNDITLWPRIISGAPIIQVYEQDQTILIAEFTNLNDNHYNRILLINLISNSQDIFDLQVSGGSVEFDHIVDPTNYLDPDSDISASWSGCTGTGCPIHWDTIDDGVRQPATPDVTNYITSTVGSVTDDLGMTTLPNVDVVSDVMIWIYTDRQSGGTNFWVDISDGTTWQGVQSFSPPNGPGWVSVPWTALSWNQNQLDNMQVRMYGTWGGGKSVLAYAMYAEVTYTELIVNNPPTITIASVDNIGEITPDNLVDLTAGQTTQVEVIFDVTDLEGFADINDSSVNISLDYNLGGEPMRNIFTCLAPTNDGLNTKTYTCTVNMEFYDAPGAWTAIVNISDFTGPASNQSNQSFTINPVTGISSVPINFGTLTPGTIDQTATGIVTNEGNTPIVAGGISIQSENLIGQSQPSENIPGDLFKAAGLAQADVCGLGTLLSPVSFSQTITSFTLLPKGAASTETISYCLTQVPTISAQLYSTNTPWEITILAVPLIIARRKKKSKKKKKNILEDAKFLELLDENLEDLLAFVKQNKLKTKLQEIKIPLEIFKQKLSPAEALCKYLKENENLKFNEIAIALNRDQRTIWINYRNANKKMNEKIQVSSQETNTPINIFEDRKWSILESIVKDLRNKGFTNSRIAELLGKTTSNIWTLYSRIQKKQ